MKISKYIEKPFWGIPIICRKGISYIRGLAASMAYRSGTHIRIGRGVELDCPNIRFGDHVSICSNVRIFGAGSVLIGDNVIIGDGTIICSAEKVEIGNDTMIAGQCYIIDCNHSMHQGELMRNQPVKCKPIHIGNNSWIGAGSKIIPGGGIGNGTVIGAGAVINYSIPDDSILVPCRDSKIVPRV